MRYIFFLLLLLSSVASIAQLRLSPPIKHYQMKIPGLHSVYRVLATKNGVLLIAGQDGLVEYDGHQFNRLMADLVFDVAEGNDGQIYIAADSFFGVLQSDARGVVSVQSFNKYLPDSIVVRDVRHIRVSATKIFFVSFRYIFEVDKQHTSIIVYPAQSADGNYRNGFTVGDSLFVCDPEVGLLIAYQGKVTKAPHSIFFQGHYVNGVVRLDQGKFLLGWKELIEYTPDEKVLPKPVLLSNRSQQVRSNSYQAASTEQSYLHVHEATPGGATITDHNHHVLYEYNGVPGTTPRSIFKTNVDNQKNYWLTYEDSNDGLLTKIGSDRDILLADDHTSLQAVFSVKRHNGLLYVGCNQGLYYVDANHVLHKVPGTDDIHYSMAHVNIDGEVKLLVSNMEGISEVVGDRLVRILQGPREGVLMLQSKINPHRVYVSGQSRLYSLLYKNKKWIDEGKIADAYGMPLEEADGTLWIPDYKRMVRYKPGSKTDSLSFFEQEDGLIGACGDPFLINGQVVISSDSGFRTFDKSKNQFVSWNGFGTFNDPSKRFAEVRKVNDSTYYLISFHAPSTTVRCVVSKSGEVHYESNPFKRLTDLGSVWDSWVDTDGTLWLGGSFGLIMLNERLSSKDYTQPFNCLIRKVKIGVDSTAFNGGLSFGEANRQNPTLPFDKNIITFNFAAPYLEKEEATMYSYRLQGMTDTWSEWDKVYYKEYSNLSEGKYEFQVKAKNVFGIESAVATYPFTILPPWYRTWWAYGLYILLSGLGVAALIHQRTRYINQRRKELEKVVDQQTSELKTSNSELRATNESLIQTQRKLVASEKMASLGQLTAGIAHEINNPINFISGGVQALRELHQEALGRNLSDEERYAKQKEVEELMTAIMNGVHRTSDIIRSLREFSSPSNQLDETVFTDIPQCITNSLLLLRSRIKDYQVKVITHFAVQSYAHAISAQVSQVIVNLVDNGIDAVSQRNDDREIRITAEETAREIIIRVMDNGTGIPSDKQSHVFEPFFTTKPVGKGVGLGLFICYSIVQKHGGSLTFESTTEGTTFIVTLPKKS